MENIEIQISNLENQIMILREKQRVERICSSIEKKADIRDNAVKNEYDELMMKLVDYKLKIDDRADDLLNIHKIAVCLRENDYNVPTKFPSNRITLDFHKNDYDEYIAELSIINNKANPNDGYLLVKTNGNLSCDKEDYQIRCYVIDAINRGIWDRALTNEERIKYLKRDIDLMEEYLTNYDLFLNDFYNYAENI